MSGLRGIYAEIASLVLGAIVGLVVSMMVIQAAQMKTTQELYVMDVSSLNMLYMGRNLQEYIRLCEDGLVKEFVETGGPAECGRISFENKSISIWKSGDCNVEYSRELAEKSAGFMADGEAGRYGTLWHVETSAVGDSFCLALNDEFQYGQYHSKVCFNSTLFPAIDAAFQEMAGAYDTGSADCGCFDTYSICWTELGDYNFTYALRENC